MHGWRSLVSGLSTVVTSQLVLSVGSFNFDDAEVQRVVLATLLSAAGGLAAALVPVDEKSWSWWGFLRLVVLGALVGIPTSIAMADARIAWLGSGRPWIEFAAGVLAYPIIRTLQKTGPVKLFWSVVSRFKPAAE